MRIRPAVRAVLVVVAVVSMHAGLLPPASGGETELPVTRFPVPTDAARPYGIAVGLDGNLWVTESNGNKVARVTPKGRFREYELLRENSGPYNITTGPDGKIWFTERLGNRIGRIDPRTGDLDEWTAPTGDSQPWDITTGPDGSLWFSQTEGNVNQITQIAEITTDGRITEYLVGTCSCFAIGIASGRDGHIWVAEEIGNRLLRVNTEGEVVDRFDLPEVQSLPWDVAPGPDGAIWFTEIGTHDRVGRVTVGGTIKEYGGSGTFTGTAGIVTGSDGNLWFTENDGHRVVAIDPSGNVVHVVDVGTRPVGITAGPDGNIWYTEADGNHVGRIEIARRDRAYVVSLDAGFAPRGRRVRQGTTVQWSFYGPNVHSVSDPSGMDLFGSGPRAIVSFYTFRFDAAGTYRYRDQGNETAGGQIVVPIKLAREGSVGQPFRLTWSAAPPRPGFVFDVEVREPGSGSWSPWMTGVTDTTAMYPAAEAGRYRFRARLRESSGGAHSGWSPTEAIDVV